VTVEDFEGKSEVNSISEFVIVMQKRYGHGVNGFWISHFNEKHPVMSLLVKGCLSTLLYVPAEGHPGFVPVGSEEESEEGEYTTFSIDTIEQELEVSIRQVINISKAMVAVREFFSSSELPRSIEWREL
jgi:hypothetical protein